MGFVVFCTHITGMYAGTAKAPGRCHSGQQPEALNGACCWTQAAAADRSAGVEAFPAVVFG